MHAMMHINYYYLCFNKVLVWFRKGRNCDMLSSDEFGVVSRCSWRFRTIWNYYKGKNCSCASSEEGTFKSWELTRTLSCSFSLQHFIILHVLLFNHQALRKHRNVLVLKALCHHFSLHPIHIHRFHIMLVHIGHPWETHTKTKTRRVTGEQRGLFKFKKH